MSRSERLLGLLQLLRGQRRPVGGRALAERTGVSLRTLYRDIASLRAQGAPIEGEPGVGYQLRPGFLLPPLMFTAEELEALALGSRWVAGRADTRLREAAASAMARIGAVLPRDLRDDVDASTLLIGPSAQAIPPDTVDAALLRAAIRASRVLRIRYRDADGASSERLVWPFALAFFDSVRVLLGWCELRGDFRHFRTDRIAHAEDAGRPCPQGRRTLLAAWREAQRLPEPAERIAAARRGARAADGN